MEPSAAERRRNFVLTWLAYGAYYLCRRPFPIAKSTIGKLYALDERVLGRMETAYLVAYALGQFASGLAADRFGARRLVGYGMLAVAVVSTAFGLGSEAAVFALAFTLQGLLQATGWPGVVKAMATIFRRGERGTAMGLWATSYQVGGLAASGLATYVLVHFGWRASFFVPAALTAAVGLAVLRWLWEAPPGPPQERRRASLEVVREPLLWALAASYFCIKLIRYTLIFWLPYFYERALHYDTERAGYLSISFDLGGVAGAILGGRLFDRTGRFRGWLIVVLGFGLALGTTLYSRAALSGPLAAFAGMVLVGALLFGPDALVSSMAAQDLGGPAGAGTAAGFINGIGSVGAALQGILIGEVASRYGWNAVFWMFGLLSVTAALMVVPYAIATMRTNQGRV